MSRSNKLTPEVRDALDQLDGLVDLRPSLAQPIAMLREVLPVLFREPSSETVTLTQSAAVDKLRRDTPLLQASMLFVAAGYCIANALADVGYALLDPRIRYT